MSKEIEIKSSLVNDKDFEKVKDTIIKQSLIDGEHVFRVKLVEYINDTADNDDDKFFYDMLPFIRFLNPNSQHRAYTDPTHRIFLNAPGAKIGKNYRQWDFTYDHECLHQLWDTFGVADKIKSQNIDYDHDTLNVASDCVINHYLYFYRKKEMPNDVITPEYLKKKYNVDYDHKVDTQFTLYMKLIEHKDEIHKDLFCQNALNKIKPKSVSKQQVPPGPQPPQGKHSEDYIKGWTDAITDVTDKNVDPLDPNLKPKSTGNDEYDNGYNDCMDKIKEGMENGITIPDGATPGGNGEGSDLPQIPWDTGEDDNQDDDDEGGESGGDSGNQSDKNDSPADKAQKSADSAQQSADAAQKAADAAQKAADAAEQTGDSDSAEAAQEAADEAQEAANEAKDAANKAKAAAKDAKDAENNGDSEGAEEAAKKAADAAKEAADAARKAAKATNDSAESTDDAAENAEDGESKSNAKDAADKAKKAAQNAQNTADGKGADGQESNQQNNNSNSDSSSQKAGKGHIDAPEEEEDLEKLKEEAEEIINNYRNKLAGDLAEFVAQCRSTVKLEKDGLAAAVLKGVAGWNTELDRRINKYVKQVIFQKKRQYEQTFHRIKRGTGYVKQGEPLKPGRKVKDQTMVLNCAYYIDRSGSMSGSIDKVYSACYTICEALKKKYRKEKVIEDMVFKILVFDDYIEEIKYGTKKGVGGGTMPMAQLLKGIQEHSNNYLLNIVITDGYFDVDDNEVKNFIKNVNGIVVYIVNNDCEQVKNLAKELPTKLFYIRAESDFKIDI